MKDSEVCKEMATDMIEKEPVKAAWIFWDGLMKVSQENKEQSNLEKASEDMYDVLIDLQASNSYWWQEAGLEIADEVDRVIKKAKGN